MNRLHLLAGAACFVVFAASAWLTGARDLLTLVLAGAGGALFPLVGFPLLERSLGARTESRVATALLVLLALAALVATGPRVVLALGLLLVVLGAAWDGRQPLIAGWSAPAAALGATWAYPAVGIVAICALILLHAAALPHRDRLRADGLPQLVGIAVAATVLVLLPLDMIPVSRLLRAALLVAAVLLSLTVGRVVVATTLDARGRNLVLALAAALPMLALLFLIALQPRLPLPPAEPGPALLAGLLVLLFAAVAVCVLFGFTLLLSTANRAKGWALALAICAPLGWLVGGSAAAIVLLPLVVVAAPVGFSGIFRRRGVQQGPSIPLSGSSPEFK